MKELDSKEAFCVCMYVLKLKDLGKLNEQTRAYRVADLVLQVCVRTDFHPGNCPVLRGNHHSSFETENVLPKTQQTQTRLRNGTNTLTLHFSLSLLLTSLLFFLLSPNISS